MTTPFETKEEVILAALEMYVNDWTELERRLNKVLDSGQVAKSDWNYLLIRAVLEEHGNGYINSQNKAQKKICKLVASI